jgi:DNA (cytosine-5)-methyltransferase 1
MNAACFGVPQDRDRLIFVGVREDIRKQLPTLDISEFSPSRPQTAPISFAEACWDLRGNCEDDRMLPQVLKDVARYQPHSWSTHRDVYRHFKGNTASSMSLQWASWDRTCGTILKSEIHLAGIVHPDRERYISLREAKRIASFPDDFQFTNRKKGIERIGNSVPPLFMKAIAAHVRERVLVPASSTSSVCA